MFEQIKRDHVIRSDNGPEFLGGAFKQWSEDHDVVLQPIQPGKPNQNAFIEHFNRTCREDVLDQHLFASLQEVRETPHGWMIADNASRPHDARDGATPTEYRHEHTQSSTFDLST